MLTDKQKITFLKAFTEDIMKNKSTTHKQLQTAPAKYKWAAVTEHNWCCFSKIRKESKIVKLNCVWGLQNITQYLMRNLRTVESKHYWPAVLACEVSG